MGRLTLNVLLSFAQFEREVTAERIRDKIAASKAKGMWMGGSVPFGYRNEDKKLHVREEEAKIVRSIFELYLELKNVRLVKAELDNQGVLSRKRISPSGKSTDGTPFSRGILYRILKNPAYIGRIKHKKAIYEGEHDGLISLPLWDAVQTTLKDNATNRKMVGNSKSPALLAGLLFDKDANPLVPHHANKQGKRYHYYVSQRLKTGDQDTGWRVPIHTLDRTVKDTVVETLSSKSAILDILSLNGATADKLQALTVKAKALGQQIKSATHLTLKSIYNELITSVTLETGQLCITFNTQGFEEHISTELTGDTLICLVKPMTIRRRGQEMKMVIGGQIPKTTNPDPVLINLVTKAHVLRTGLESGSIASIKDFGRTHRINHADAKRMLPLAYLAPDIVKSILTGNQPEDLTVLRLKNGYDLPILWSEQRAYLGFTP